MDILRLNAILKEIDKIQKPQDLLMVTIINGEVITGILLEKIPYREILHDGTDTNDKPTKFKMKSLNNKNPEYDNKELIIGIFQIHKIEVVTM